MRATVLYVALMMAILFIVPSSISLAKQPLFNPPNPSIKIPGVTFTKITDIKKVPCAGTAPEENINCFPIPWIGEYINGIYIFAISVATILAAVVLLLAGFIWLTAAGNVALIGTAKNYATGAILGLILILGSYTILYLINPKLVQFNALSIKVVSPKRVEPATMPTSGLSYAPGIASQKKHASNQLINLIQKISREHYITVISISDSNIAKGTCQPWNPESLFNQRESSGNCQHSKNSAHYGGPNGIKNINDTKFSCAVDIKSNSGEWKKLELIVNKYADFFQCERRRQKINNCTDATPDHIHASISGCNAL